VRAGRRATARMRSIPAPLTLLLCAVAVVGACWALLNPAGQAPDEPAHVGYAQEVAEDFDLPDDSPGRTYSPEWELALARANAFQAAQTLPARPEWSRLAEQRWRRAAARLPADNRAEGGGVDPVRGGNPARANPPAYYLYSAVAYRVAGGDFFDRLYAMRLWSVLLLLVATSATWLLIGELVGPRRELQLAGAALVGLQPMAVFVSSSVNPDSMLIASFALAMWLGVRLLCRGLTLWTGIGLGAATALAVLTKGTGYALVPAVALALAVAARRLAVRERAAGTAAARDWTAWGRAGAAALTFAIPVAIWLAIARALDRSPVNDVPSGASGAATPHIGLVDYLWQFYLPKLPFLGPVPGIARLPAYDVWIKTGWAAFGWLEVRFPEPVYIGLALLTVALLLGGLWAAFGARPRLDPWIGVFLGLIVLCLLAGLHWVEWRELNAHGAAFNQGRYLLPVLPVLGACAGCTLARLPARVRAPTAGALVGALFVLQLLALGINAARFYA
jgi:4-amino-4-deoxy-L-arabinose transferase-like glycosyltransferase